MAKFFMQDDESAYPEEWLRLAERDLTRVERLLKAEDPSLAGFCLQQAVEKSLKAFLLARAGASDGFMTLKHCSTMPSYSILALNAFGPDVRGLRPITCLTATRLISR